MDPSARFEKDADAPPGGQRGRGRMMARRWRGRLIAAGNEAAMALDQSYVDCVAFVCKDDVAGIRSPRGTAFFVSIPGETGVFLPYAVTAAHVVKDGNPSWLRLRRHDGGPPEDVPVGKWKIHPSADVAMTPFWPDPAYKSRSVPEHQFVDRWHENADSILVPGDRADYIGLLANVQTMHDRAIPMFRSGSVGAFYQVDIPMRDDTTGEIHDEPSAHLIDCHSVGGFSGSPVFVGQMGIVTGPSGDLAISGMAALLGVLIGHFAGPYAGVAIAVPVEAIREMLSDPDFVEERIRRETAIRELLEKERMKGVDTLDMAAGVNDGFSRFEDLTRKLVTTPEPQDEIKPKRKAKG
jgi:hypothetical protein